MLVVTTVSVSNGGILGMFICSMVNPWVTSQGLVAGTVAGVAAPIYLALSFRHLELERRVVYYPKLLTTARCNEPRFGGNFTRTLTTGFGGQGTKVFIDFTDFMSTLTAVSFYWYQPIGVVCTLVVSAVVSWCGGCRDLSEVDPKLIIPQLRWLLPDRPQQQRQEPQESVPLKIFDDAEKDVSETPGEPSKNSDELTS